MERNPIRSRCCVGMREAIYEGILVAANKANNSR